MIADEREFQQALTQAQRLRRALAAVRSRRDVMTDEQFQLMIGRAGGGDPSISGRHGRLLPSQIGDSNELTSPVGEICLRIGREIGRVIAFRRRRFYGDR